MKLHVIQHVPFETPGNIEKWAAKAGHTISKSFIYQSPTLPKLSEFDGLVIMGGPMGAYEDDEYPWLAAEKKLIESAISADKYVLGVCLGAQLMASALGAKVYPGAEKEIGWFPLWLTESGQSSAVFKGLPAEFEVLHWHGDTFELPAGVTTLASSELTPNQAFLCGTRALALQFHLELGADDAQRMVDFCGHELKPGKFVQDGEKILESEDGFEKSEKFLFQVLDNLFG